MGGMVMTPDGAIPLSADEAKALLDAARAAEEERLARMLALTVSLQKKCDAAVRAKRPIERRWIDDLRQYEGQSRIAGSKDRPSDDTGNGPPRLHVTRARTDLWEARLSDMIFPANDKSWDLTIRECNYPKTGDEAQDQAHRMVFDARCAGMRDVVNEQLGDCKFVRSGRRMIRDACRIGTGLVMGPMNGLKIKRHFLPSEGGMTVEISETHTPEIREGDPWCFYPDMVPSADKAEFAFYLHLMSPREVQELAQYPNFNAEEVAKLLDKEPELGEVGTNIAARNSGLMAVESTTDRYAIWRYTGSITRKEYEALGLDECGCDPLQPMPFVDIWFSQGCILKAKEQPIDKDSRIPYYVFSPFPCDDSMFGYSLPYLCRDSARSADAAYQIMLHNSSVSSGPLVVARKGKIEPADGKHEIRGPKWIWATDEEKSLNDLFKFDMVPNASDAAMNVLQTAIKFVDMELNAEQWATPDPNVATTQTASGLAMLMNAKSILQRRAAACADDEVFVPIIERMVWWNLLYNDREDIRGDFDVVARSQSVNLVKDIQAQHLQVFTSMSQDPRFSSYVDNYELLKANTSMLDVPVSDLLKDRQKAEEEMANQKPPAAEAVAQATAAEKQARAMLLQRQAEGEGAETQAAIERNQAELASRNQHRLLDHQEFQQEQATRAAESASRVEIERMRQQTALVKLAEELNLSREQAAALLQQHETTVNAKLTEAGMKAGMQAKELAVKQQTGSGI